jgi:hypothetical protein
MKDLDLVCSELRATEPYLEDNGFTAVLMARLPRRRQLPDWVKNVLLLGATALGSLICALQLPADLFGTVLLALVELPRLDMQALLSMAVQNLPVLLLACFAISYLLPYGAIVAIRRGAV